MSAPTSMPEKGRKVTLCRDSAQVLKQETFRFHDSDFPVFGFVPGEQAQQAGAIYSNCGRGQEDGRPWLLSARRREVRTGATMP